MKVKAKGKGLNHKKLIQISKTNANKINYTTFLLVCQQTSGNHSWSSYSKHKEYHRILESASKYKQETHV